MFIGEWLSQTEKQRWYTYKCLCHWDFSAIGLNALEKNKQTKKTNKNQDSYVILIALLFISHIFLFDQIFLQTPL